MPKREMPNPNDPQADDYSDLSETLIRLVEVYTLPFVLDRLGYVVIGRSARPGRGGAVVDDVGRALRELVRQAKEAGGKEAGGE